jgi:hypothetical protein
MPILLMVPGPPASSRRECQDALGPGCHCHRQGLPPRERSVSAGRALSEAEQLQAEAKTTLSSLLPAPRRPVFSRHAQPVKASKPPVGADWVHEIKHDGYRIIVRRDGPTVRLHSRNAFLYNLLR